MFWFKKDHNSLQSQPQSEKEKALKELLYDPFNHELIKKIAKDCDRYFEIVRPSDGYIIRCYPENYLPPAPQEFNRDVW